MTIAVAAMSAAVATVTVVANLAVDRHARTLTYQAVADVPHRHVGLLLGTSPRVRSGRPNPYFVNRIATASALYHAGKVDFLLVSGDNRTIYYNEPIAMRDSLMARGVPADRIVLDYAGFRTLDSVVRAHKVFGCDSLTIITNAGHAPRALYTAGAHGINAVAMVAPDSADFLTQMRFTVREWLACDKMMIDLFTGKQPHFLGEPLPIL